jgi:hypothetical protein
VIPGRFDVRHGRNVFSRLCARWSRLPREAAACDLVLTIEPRGESERWIRRFGDAILTTIQCTGTDACLHERFGMLEFTFELQLEGRTLRHLQRAAVLKLGGISIPLPRWLAPTVTGFECAAADDHTVQVEVEVRLPVLGLLIAYSGTVDWMESRSL